MVFFYLGLILFWKTGQSWWPALWYLFFPPPWCDNTILNNPATFVSKVTVALALLNSLSQL